MNESKKFELFVDGDKYDWDKPTINGSQLRTLAGIPANAEIFEHVPGRPDLEIKNDTVVDLAKHHGPVRFSTQSPGSQAG